MRSIRHAVSGAISVMIAAMWSTVPAAATGEIVCLATDGSNASIDIEIGHVPVLAVLGATATDGTEVWSTRGRENTRPFVLGQGFMDHSQVLIDFTDPNIEGVVVSLRLFHIAAGKSFAEAGVLSFSGGPVFPVQCDTG
jgi:hypothetical protein